MRFFNLEQGEPMKRMNVLAVVTAAAVSITFTGMAEPLEAQGLRSQIGQLFIFGDGDDPLFLSGSADPNNPMGVQVHGNHFVPAAVGSNGRLIGFLTNAIAQNVASIPLNATSGGVTFRIEAGVPVATSTSPGPILGERSQTLGGGRMLIGGSLNRLSFQSLRGIPLDNMRLTFTHENSNFPNCDQVFGGDCSRFGVPAFENDVIDLDLNLDLNVTAFLFSVTYGLTDRIDLGVAVPVVSTSFRGHSQAQIVPFGAGPVNHFFGGTSENPVLSASRTIDGSATGLGDIVARLKVALAEREAVRFGLLGDIRLPTGDEEDLLGSGEVFVRALGIVSAEIGGFSPHLNVGYAYRGGEIFNDAFLTTVGFSQMLAPWATLALDFVSELQVGQSNLEVPEPVLIDAPFRRTIRTSNIPNRRDDLASGSVGFKFATPAGVNVITNAISPLNQGGLRTGIAWMVGVEYSF
jgi:hypothetical protein